MTVTRDDYCTAAALCTTEIDRLYQLLMLFGMGEHAEMVRSVDKGQLIARVVTHGCDFPDFAPGELLVLALVCIREAGAAGASAAEIRAVLNEMRGDLAARQILQRIREGSKP